MSLFMTAPESFRRDGRPRPVFRIGQFGIGTTLRRAFPLFGSMMAGLLASAPAGAIVGGQPTDPDEYRWPVVVLAEKSRPDTGRRGLCGGSLIARDWVMTAAHCIFLSVDDRGNRYVDASKVNVRVGSWRWESGGRVIRVSELHPHPEYDSDLDVNDIALLKLAEPAPADLGAVAFPDEAAYRRIAIAGTEATALGWGVDGIVHARCNDDDDDNDVGCPDLSPVLREVGLVLRPEGGDSCSSTLDLDAEVCAGGTPGRDTCFSDSGGPLLLEERGAHYQIGITSSGSPQCDGVRSGTYTRVARFHDWIRRTTRIGERFFVSMETSGPVVVAEGDDAVFTVSLAPASGVEIGVPWSVTARGDDTAAERTDYRPGNGVVTFAAGETEATIRVRAVADSLSEGAETFVIELGNLTTPTATLPGAPGAPLPVVLGTTTASATISAGGKAEPDRNAEIVAHAVANMVGRGAARAAVDAVGGRYRARASESESALSLALAGRDVGALRAMADAGPSGSGQAARTALGMAALLLDADGGPDAGAALSAAGAVSGEDGPGDAYASAGRWLDWRGVTSRDLLDGGAFNLNLSGGRSGSVPGSGGWSVWGEGAFNGFESENAGMILDGGVASFHMGADYRFGQWLLGLAVGRNRGETDFRDATVEGADRSAGTVEMELLNVLPYAQWSPDGRGESLVWGTVGVGSGEAGLKRKGRETSKGDLETLMIAGGARLPLAWRVGGWDVAAKADAFRVASKTGALRTPDGTVQAAAGDRAHSSRLRGGAELVKTRELPGGEVDWRLEFAGRLDDGYLSRGARLSGSDVFERPALGAEVGSSVGFTGANGLTAAFQGRYSVARGASAREEWGVRSRLAYAPGDAGRGLGFSMAPEWGGAPSETGATWSDARWLEGIASSGTGSRENGGWMPVGMRARVDYGLNVYGGRVFMKPYGEVSLESGSVGRMRIGARANAPWRPGEGMALETFVWSDGGIAPDGVMLRGRLGF